MNVKECCMQTNDNQVKSASTFSDQYQAQQKSLHQDSRYGRASVGFSPLIVDIIERTGFRSVTDYGAGKCRLRDELVKKIAQFSYFPFDPAFPEYGIPQAAELVVCIDVLEHIEPEYLETVIAELASITTHVGFFSIHTAPATKTLSDGRNAHLIQQPASWWLLRLLPHFDVIQLTPLKKGFWVLVERKGANYSQYFEQKKDHHSRSEKLFRKILRFIKPIK